MSVFSLFREEFTTGIIDIVVPAGRTWIVHAMHFSPVTLPSEGSIELFYFVGGSDDNRENAIYHRTFVQSETNDSDLFLNDNADRPVVSGDVGRAALPKIPLPSDSILRLQRDTPTELRWLLLVED